MWILDLDGVVWRGDEAIDGASEAVATLRARGHAVAFVTNSALRTRSQVAEKLARHGIPDAVDEVFTAAMAAARLVERGERVLACGADGVVDELNRRGAVVVDEGPADAVVVGLRLDFDYDLLTRAMRATRGGARLIATNDDATFPHEDGLLPGNGALVAAVERASGVAAVVAGKPHAPMADLLRAHFDAHFDDLGEVRRAKAGVVVGDRPETDGLFARALGFDYALVLSGVTDRADLPVEPMPDLISEDLISAVRAGI